MTPAYEDWVAEARAVPIEVALGAAAGGLKRLGRELVGPCPVCGGRDRFGVNVAKGVFLCRGSGAGGDAIALVRYLEAADFNGACEILTGRPMPGGAAESVAERAERAKLRAARAARAAAGAVREAERAREADFYRERERRRAHELWRSGVPIAGTAAERYLAHRCLVAPPGARLRFAADHPYCEAQAGGRVRVLARGPALLAAITDAEGVFRGLHTTWLDPRLAPASGEALPASASGKAAIVHPETGEVLPAKKVRGSAGGHRIELVRVGEPARLVLGEGIETVLSVWRALAAHQPEIMAGTAFWAAISLGNMAGRAVSAIAHPTARRLRRDGGDGGPQRVAGPEPDLASMAVAVPDSVAVLYLVGDGDSDPFATACALERAGRRHARRRDGSAREIRIAMAPQGLDFNDVLRGVAPARGCPPARGAA